MGIPLAFYAKMCFDSYIYLKPHRLFDVTQLCRKTRGPSGLNCVIGFPCALISRIDGAIRNNVASMFTRTCRLFSIVVTSPKYTFNVTLFLCFCRKSCPHLGRWLNVDLNGQFVIAIWRIIDNSCMIVLGLRLKIQNFFYWNPSNGFREEVIKSVRVHGDHFWRIDLKKNH